MTLATAAISRFRQRNHEDKERFMTTPLPRRARPMGICVRCGRAHSEQSFEKTAICLRPDPTGGVCGGRVTWRADPHEWVECPGCAATGQIGEDLCPRCDGAGWLLQSRERASPDD